jgi:hypothetical protein
MDQTTPDHYRTATRTLLRFAIAMAVVGLLSGILFQESGKRLALDTVDPGLRTHATIHLALVHGHIFVTCVLLPLAMAGMLFLAVKVGGAPVGPRAVAFATRGYLPFVTATVVLMLYKGYHFLLKARGGEESLAAIDGSFFGGSTAVRAALYGLAHTGMAVTLVVFLVAVWRSLKAVQAED